MLNIIQFLGDDWLIDHRRPHVQALARQCRVLAVEPPVTVDYPFRHCSSFLKWYRGKKPLRQINDSLWLLKPIAITPYYLSLQNALLRALNRKIIKRTLTKALSFIGMTEKTIAVISHPCHTNIIDMFENNVLCYEVYDAYNTSPRLPVRDKKRLTDVENNLLNRVDIVFCSAQNLAESRRNVNPNTHFMPNAADTDFFGCSLDTATEIPPDLRILPGPRVGLIGNINDIVDLELINYLAAQRPSWTIVLIGMDNGTRKFKMSEAYRKSKSMRNIHCLGWRPYETLPAYQKGLDVCLLPYKINEYTNNVYPNKVHQYLAGAKPVVSTAIPEMVRLNHVIYVADNYPDFLARCDAALEPVHQDIIKYRVKVAHDNSLEKQVTSKIKLLRDELHKKEAPV